MPLQPLHHITLSVASLERSMAFYRDALRMRVTLEDTISDEAHVRYLRLPAGTVGRAAVLQLGPPVGAVEVVEWSPPLPDVREVLPPAAVGSFILAFEVRDETIESVAERIRAAGGDVWGEPETSEVSDYGSIRAVIASDPDGTLLELLELPSREEVQRRRAHLRAVKG